MSGKYVRVDDVIKLINTSNRGFCDYFIVDQIEELCRSEKIYDVDKVLKQLEDEKSHMSLLDDELEIYKSAIDDAIEIVKTGGNIDEQS